MDSQLHPGFLCPDPSTWVGDSKTLLKPSTGLIGERMANWSLVACSAVQLPDRQNPQTQGLVCIPVSSALTVLFCLWLSPVLLMEN